MVKLLQSWLKWNILSLQNEIIIISLQCRYDSVMFSNSRKIEVSIIYMKISIMKAGLCIAGQLSNLTKSKKKNKKKNKKKCYLAVFLWLVNRLEKRKHQTKFLCYSETNFNLKIMLDCLLSGAAVCMNNYFLKQFLLSLHE